MDGTKMEADTCDAERNMGPEIFAELSRDIPSGSASAAKVILARSRRLI